MTLKRLSHPFIFWSGLGVVNQQKNTWNLRVSQNPEVDKHWSTQYNLCPRMIHCFFKVILSCGTYPLKLAISLLLLSLWARGQSHKIRLDSLGPDSSWVPQTTYCCMQLHWTTFHVQHFPHVLCYFNFCSKRFFRSNLAAKIQPLHFELFWLGPGLFNMHKWASSKAGLSLYAHVP